MKKGQLVAIVGRVGSGKSSLLYVLLGEMHKQSSNVKVNGTIVCALQQAWIQNMSLNDNILFDSPYDQDNYKDVIENCALKENLANLPAGDRNKVGKKGINSSGGQKQRVSFARAIYQNSGILLLDDPLSAVDSHVGNVISSSTGCLQNKTRILVTHGLTYFKNCELLKDGQIEKM